MPFLGRIVGGCGCFACDYEKLTFSAFNLQYLKNIVLDVFSFINYEDLGKSTIPSTVGTQYFLYYFIVVLVSGYYPLDQRVYRWC